MGVTVVDDTEPVEPGAEPDGEELPAPRRGRTALIVSVAVAVVLAAFVVVLATREPATDRIVDSPLVGKPAPFLEGETLAGGNFNVDDHAGKWVVVNFFATWCVPCQREHPQLIRFDETHRQLDDAVLVSVVFDDQADDVSDYFDQNGGEWPLVAGNAFEIIGKWGVSGVPETYLVAPSGRVVAKVTGGVTQGGLERIMADWEAQFEAGS